MWKLQNKLSSTSELIVTLERQLHDNECLLLSEKLFTTELESIKVENDIILEKLQLVLIKNEELKQQMYCLCNPVRKFFKFFSASKTCVPIN